jgi:simple sugar transport system substrate-binding protein
MDACVSQDPIAYGQIAVEMLGKYAMKKEPVPIGPYENKKYFWERGEIVAGKTGPTLIIPPFVIDQSNAADARHWGAIAEVEWKIPYT